MYVNVDMNESKWRCKHMFNDGLLVFMMAWANFSWESPRSCYPCWHILSPTRCFKKTLAIKTTHACVLEWHSRTGLSQGYRLEGVFRGCVSFEFILTARICNTTFHTSSVPIQHQSCPKHKRYKTRTPGLCWPRDQKNNCEGHIHSVKDILSRRPHLKRVTNKSTHLFKTLLSASNIDWVWP